MNMKMRTKLNRQQGGFTLIEIIIVMIILAGLAAYIIPKVTDQSESAQRRQAKVKMADITAALSLHKLEVGKYPENLQGLISASGVRGWNGPYLKDASYTKDNWGNDYKYTVQAGKYTLMSLGADGREGGAGQDADIQGD
jgi:general secretion pathway protein G